jgi:mRNA interferase MazF
MPQQGDIVLVPVPFSDLSSQKRRPVIVMSNDAYNRASADMVVVAMTSNPARVDHGFVIGTSDLEHGRLNRPGTVRFDKVFSLSQSLVAATFGRVSNSVLERVDKGLLQLLKPEN